MKTLSTGTRLYERHAGAADQGTWSVERDIAWERIDRRLARSQPDLLDQIRAAALIESFHPVNLGTLMRLTWDDVDAGVAFSLEAYEGFKHFHALRTYLDLVGHSPAITEGEIVACRTAAAEADAAASGDDLLERLVEFMLSEHLAFYFFRRLSQRAREPVLRDLLGRIARDEVRHAQAASDLIEKRIGHSMDARVRVLEAAVRFRHFGERAIGEVPVALPGDAVAIRTFATRIARLTGMRLVDHLKATL